MPTTIAGVLIIVMFVMPGFVASQVITFAYPRSEPGEGKLILEALTLSSLNYAFLSWLLILAYRHRWYEDSIGITVLAVGTLVLVPVLLGFCVVWISEAAWLNRVRIRFGMTNPVPTAWDSHFRRARPCWVMATLKNGILVAGLYGPNSAASSYPAPEDLYLEKLCRLSPSGEILGLEKNSAGGIIRMEEAYLLEFFDLELPPG